MRWTRVGKGFGANGLAEREVVGRREERRVRPGFGCQTIREIALVSPSARLRVEPRAELSVDAQFGSARPERRKGVFSCV